MDTGNRAAPGPTPFTGRNAPFSPGGDYEYSTEEQQPVERSLAHYVFVREERDREVRLVFRDVPAADIARAFRAAGAALISVTGERVVTASAIVPPVQAAGSISQEGVAENAGVEVGAAAAEADTGTQASAQKKRRKTARPGAAQGELMLLYFYALRETVYTVSITLTTGIAESISSVYPGARLPERDIQQRMSVPFGRGWSQGSQSSEGSE